MRIQPSIKWWNILGLNLKLVPTEDWIVNIKYTELKTWMFVHTSANLMEFFLVGSNLLDLIYVSTGGSMGLFVTQLDSFRCTH